MSLAIASERHQGPRSDLLFSRRSSSASPQPPLRRSLKRPSPPGREPTPPTPSTSAMRRRGGSPAQSQQLRRSAALRTMSQRPTASTRVPPTHRHSLPIIPDHQDRPQRRRLSGAGGYSAPALSTVERSGDTFPRTSATAAAGYQHVNPPPHIVGQTSLPPLRDVLGQELALPVRPAPTFEDSTLLRSSSLGTTRPAPSSLSDANAAADTPPPLRPASPRLRTATGERPRLPSIHHIL